MVRVSCILKSIFASLVLTAGLLPPAMAQDLELVDNTPFEITEEGVTVALVTVRPLTAAGFGESDETRVLQRFRLTKQLIADAAAQFDEVRAELARRELDAHDVPIQDWAEILEVSGYTDVYLYDDTKARESNQQGTVEHFDKPVISDYATSPEYKIWDAVTLTNMVATGVIDTHNVETVNLDGNYIETVKFDPSLADRIASIYARKSFFEKQSPYETGLLMAALQMDIKEYNSLEQALLQYIGDITFGEPIIYTAEEKSLAVPESVRRKYDVYWIELRASFRDLEDSDIHELAVNYAFPEGGVALELMPLQYGPEVTVETKEAVPGFELELEGFRVAVNEAFNRTVAFKYLKPTVMAVGLGEGDFSWLLRGEAVRIGSHKFIVVAGVPTGTTAIDFAMSGHVRLEKGILGGFFRSGEVAGTDVKTISITF